jgi:predicted enzyme related to lactoylglutathione lyase
MAIQKIQSVYTVVRDMDKAQAFYEQALGLTVKFRDQSKWCQFAVGGSNFALSSVEEAAQGAVGSVVVFEADSVDGIREGVEAAGGAFLSERDMGAHGKVFVFLDSENTLFQVFIRQQAV